MFLEDGRLLWFAHNLRLHQNQCRKFVLKTNFTWEMMPKSGAGWKHISCHRKILQGVPRPEQMASDYILHRRSKTKLALDSEIWYLGESQENNKEERIQSKEEAAKGDKKNTAHIFCIVADTVGITGYSLLITFKLDAGVHCVKQTDYIKPRERISEKNANVYLLQGNIQMCISHSEDTSWGRGVECMIEHQRGGRYQHLSLRFTAGR